MSILGRDFFSWQAQYQPSEYVLGCSGGIDSMALLHQLYISKSQLSAPVRVIYMHHGWHFQATEWGKLIEKVARNYGFFYQMIPLQLSQGRNAEALAREARYEAFATHLAQHGVLLTAHHQNDQAETFLLNLLRGSGLEGLSAMPARRRFAQGEHWRPLLQISRVDLERYVREQGLESVHDDSNDDIRYRRNWLRHEILPLLCHCYPQAVASIAQSAQHLSAALNFQESAIDERLNQDICAALSLTLLEDKPLEQQAIFLRRWLSRQYVALPPRAQLQEFLRQISSEVDYASIAYADVVLFYYDGKIDYFSNQEIAPAPPFALETYWEGVGQLLVEKGAGLLLGRKCRWSCYPPGQAFRPVGKKYSKPLKEWLRLARIAPPLRRRLPLLWVDEQLAWVGGIGAAEAFSELELLWNKKTNSDTIMQ